MAYGSSVDWWVPYVWRRGVTRGSVYKFRKLYYLLYYHSNGDNKGDMAIGASRGFQIVQLSIWDDLNIAVSLTQ